MESRPFRQVLAKISRFNSTIYDQKLTQLKSTPENYLFHDTKALTYVIPAGVSQTQVVLSAITGRVTTLVFTVKPYTDEHFAIRNCKGSNRIKGLPLNIAFSKNLCLRENAARI